MIVDIAEYQIAGRDVDIDLLRTASEIGVAEHAAIPHLPQRGQIQAQAISCLLYTSITAVRTIGRGSSYNTTTTYTYDGSGNLVRLEEPGGRSYNFSYDAQGNHVATIDSNGIAMSRTYDSGNRVLTETVYSAPQLSLIHI